MILKPQIVAFSGGIASGKSSTCEALKHMHVGVIGLNTGELLKKNLDRYSRKYAQLSGHQLDNETQGEWVAEAIADFLRNEKSDDLRVVLLDCVRTGNQLTALRRAFGNLVIHIHISAPIPVRKERYKARHRALDSGLSFEEALEDPLEQSIDLLGAKADLRIDSSRTKVGDCAVLIASFLGLHGQYSDPLVDVLVGGQYGSEGKGHVASYLAKDYGLLIRVGGPNAGHKVYERPKPYTHHHLPSGTRFTDAKLLLGAGSCLYVPSLLAEINECEVSPDRLFIDPQAMIIEDTDRKQEDQALVESIGSTAQGVGIAAARKLMRTAAKPRVRLAKEVTELRPYLRESCHVLDDIVSRGVKIFLEGTQGTGLSIHHGIYPYVTSRETSASGCLAEAGISPRYVRRIIMVCRTYPIRVAGCSGDLPAEINWRVIEKRAGLQEDSLEDIERTSTTNRRRRVGEFDWEMFQRAASINGPTDIALTFADYITKENEHARRFEQLSAETLAFIENLERVSGAPVSLITTRFHYRSIIDRRAWR